MGPQDLINKLHEQPFQPFRARLSNNTVIDVLDAGMVIVSPTSAIMPTQTVVDDAGFRLVTRWRTVALSHIVEFTDIEQTKGEKRNGSKKR